jgi:glucose/arabinose dehydrogenase
MGPANKTQLKQLPKFLGYTYHDPQFTWEKPVAPTGLAFAKSPEYGKYQNNLFVGDCNNGNIYRFELNQDRDGFVFNMPQLQDKIANKGDPMDEIIFGTGFGCVTDIVTGPDGLLYIVSLTDGVIYRIVPKTVMPATNSDTSLQLWYILTIIIPIIIGSIFVYFKRVQKTRKVDA